MVILNLEQLELSGRVQVMRRVWNTEAGSIIFTEDDTESPYSTSVYCPL